MGMASSQARLLNLTARMHQIEYKAAKLEAQKLQLSNESSAVYDTYLEALDATKIQYSTLTSDGSITYIDATYAALQAAGYILVFKDQDIITEDNYDARILVDEGTLSNWELADGNRDYFIALESGRGTVNDNGTITVTDDEDGIEWTEIYTASQLSSMDGSSGYYRLMSDIEITDEDEWESISSFSGTLDGNGHTISGLTSALFDSLSGATVTNLNLSGTIGSEDDTATGNVGFLANSAVYGTNVSNVTASGTIYSSGTNTGGLIGYVYAFNSSGQYSAVYISNCSTNVTINSSGGNTGGLVGNVSQGCYITDCTSEGTITSSGAYTGGLVGAANVCFISNSSSSCTVNGGANSGGLVGLTASTTLTDCTASGDVTGTSYVGGLVGYCGPTSLSNCLAEGNVTSTGTEDSTYTGGLIGYLAYTVDTSSCTANGDVTSYTGYTGGLVGYDYYSTSDITTGTVSSTQSVTSTNGTVGTYYGGTENEVTVTSGSSTDATGASETSVTVETTVFLDDTISDDYSVDGYTSAGDLFDDISEYGCTTEKEEYTALTDGYYVSVSEYSADGYENDTTCIKYMIIKSERI